MTPTARTAGRALLVERARIARAALVRARDARHRGEPPDDDRARLALARYAASGAELAGADRIARRAAQAWLDAARAHLWFGTEECGRAEEMAYRCLEALPGDRCTRRDVRRARRTHAAALRRWHARHSVAIGSLTGRVRGSGPDRPD